MSYPQPVAPHLGRAPQTRRPLSAVRSGADEVPSPPDAARRRIEEDRRLFERYRAHGDLAARDALVERFLPLAQHLARRYDRGHGQSDDLVQVASIGLLNAIERYDPARGTAFSSYAVPTIGGEIKRYFRDKGWAVRVPRDLQERALAVQDAAEQLEGELGRPATVAQIGQRIGANSEAVLEARLASGAHFGISFDSPSERGDDDPRTIADVTGGLDDRLEQVEDAAVLDGLLAVLDDRERTILKLRFEHDLTQAEIAARVDLSQMHVSRLLRQAITRLRTVHQMSEAQSDVSSVTRAFRE